MIGRQVVPSTNIQTGLAESHAGLRSSGMATSSGYFRDIPGIEKQFLARSDERSPRNGEATMLSLKDGRLLLLWSRFVDIDRLSPEDRSQIADLGRRGDPGGDNGYGFVAGKTSPDGGRTWSEARVVVDDRDASVNTMCPSLLRMADGRLLLTYSWRNGAFSKETYGDCAKMARVSDDEGETWSERIRITPDDGLYHTGAHDRAWLLPSGRILVQNHHIIPHTRMHMTTYVSWSDDNGATWRNGDMIHDLHGKRFEEATLARRKDGSLLQLIRSPNGCPFSCESADDGETWSQAKPYPLTSPLSPVVIRNIPDSDEILLLWNPSWNPDQAGMGRRCPLAVAISRDGGATWGLPKALETDMRYRWEYPSVSFHEGDVLITYRRCMDHRMDLVLAQMPLEKLYEEWTGERDFSGSRFRRED